MRNVTKSNNILKIKILTEIKTQEIGTDDLPIVNF